MSLIKTDAIQTLAGKPILNSTGSVLQVVRTYVASSSVIESTSTSFVASGITASITPKASGNLILIDCVLSMTDATTDNIWTKMYQLIAGGSYAVMAGAADYQFGFQDSARWTPSVFGGSYTATSTSQLTYQPYFKSASGGNVRLVHDSSSYALTLTEIAQ